MVNAIKKRRPQEMTQCNVFERVQSSNVYNKIDKDYNYYLERMYEATNTSCCDFQWGFQWMSSIDDLEMPSKLITAGAFINTFTTLFPENKNVLRATISSIKAKVLIRRYLNHLSFNSYSLSASPN